LCAAKLPCLRKGNPPLTYQAHDLWDLSVLRGFISHCDTGPLNSARMN
jgi:hypothetical protein